MYNFQAQKTKLLKSSTEYQKYYATNKYTTAGYGMPNCTAYVLGRVNQLQDLNGLSYNNFSGWHGNGEDWGESGMIGENWVHSQVPKLGAIACYGDKPGVDIGGHVAVVEEIFNNGNVTTSNSAWRGPEQVGNENSSGWWFLEEDIKITDYRSNVFYFKYYLYPPFIDEEPIPPTPIKIKNNFNWVLYQAKKRRNKLIN